MKTGVYLATKKDGSVYYRSSITFKNKHISLGSFLTEDKASKAYLEALKLTTSSYSIEDITGKFKVLPFEKAVTIINFRDNGLYIGNPIYLGKITLVTIFLRTKN